MTYQPIQISPQDALRYLRENHFILREGPITHTRYDPRLLRDYARQGPATIAEYERLEGDLATAEAEVRAVEARTRGQARLRQLRARLQLLIRRQERATQDRLGTGATLQSSIDATRREIAELEGAEAQAQAQTGPTTEAELRRQRGTLRSQRARLREDVTVRRRDYESMRLVQDYPTDPPPTFVLGRTSTDFDNPLGVRINWLHPALVPVFRNRPLTGFRPPGRRAPRGMVSDPLDPVFAYAVVQFIKHAKANFRVSAIYCAGFGRGPKTGRDTHPRGRSWDITGFHVGPLYTTGRNVHIIHLRGGRPLLEFTVQRDPLNFGGGPSDWFEISLLIDGRTYREFMLAIVEVMAERFFGQILGPGYNAEHMRHFHVQLSGLNHPSQREHWPATPADPDPYLRHGRPGRARGGGRGSRARRP